MDDDLVKHTKIYSIVILMSCLLQQQETQILLERIIHRDMKMSLLLLLRLAPTKDQISLIMEIGLMYELHDQIFCLHGQIVVMKKFLGLQWLHLLSQV